MGKKKGIAVLLLSVAICNVCAIFCSCAPQTQYIYVDGYGNVAADLIRRGNISLYTEQDLALSQETEMRLIDALESDYRQLDADLGMNPYITVVVISDEYVLSEFGGSVYNNGLVICNSDALENDGYLPALAGAYLNTTEIWKQVAAAEYFFGDREHNDLPALRQYYGDAGNHLTLSLFQGYFCKAFASEETIDLAKKTAVSLGKYIIDNYSADALVRASLTEYRGEWMAKNGIESAFALPYDLSWLDGSTYSVKLLQYPLVIETENKVFYLDSFSAERESASFDTPEAVLRHLSMGNEGVEGILQYLRSNVGDEELLEEMITNLEGKTEYYISSREIGTEADVDGRKIYLRDPSEYVHETMHILTLHENRVEGAWLAEGVAEFFAREVCDIPGDIDYRMYDAFTQALVFGSLGSFVRDVKEKFQQLGGVFDDFDSFEFYLLEQAIAYTTLSAPEYKSSISFPYATTSVGDMRYLTSSDPGNRLTYPECYLFVKYLIGTYGMDSVLTCCLDYEFDLIFHQTYEAVYSDFIKTLNHQTYGERT